MARYHPHMWLGNANGYTRSDKLAGAFDAYVPDMLRGRHFNFSSAVAADIANATRAIAALESSALAPRITEALARLLLRAEVVASSQIEGRQLGARESLRVMAQQNLQSNNIVDATASEMLVNIDAMAGVVSDTKHN